jgi:hypothetical protein
MLYRSKRSGYVQYVDSKQTDHSHLAEDFDQLVGFLAADKLFRGTRSDSASHGCWYIFRSCISRLYGIRGSIRLAFPDLGEIVESSRPSFDVRMNLKRKLNARNSA